MYFNSLFQIFPVLVQITKLQDPGHRRTYK